MPNPGPAITSTPQTKAVMAPVNTMGQPNALPAEMNACRLLGLYRGVNANAANTDHPIPILNAGVYSVFQVVITNASISLTTATGGLFSDVGGGGTAVVASAALSALTGPTIVNQRTIASTAQRTEQTLYWRTGTPQGAVATFDVFVYGYDLTVYSQPT
ncbi:MAG TPA: hypothetical protein PKA20_17410 [Burkholderiaceae bacterium]|nr:hypothetical protein [Burkholderiaceae bacterium]